MPLLEQLPVNYPANTRSPDTDNFDLPVTARKIFLSLWTIAGSTGRSLTLTQERKINKSFSYRGGGSQLPVTTRKMRFFNIKRCGIVATQLPVNYPANSLKSLSEETSKITIVNRPPINRYKSEVVL